MAGPDDIRGGPVPVETGRLGMRLLLASLSMIFGASVVGTLIIRASAPAWPPAGMPPIPSGLWLSTVLLVISSGTLAWAKRGIVMGDTTRLKVGLVLTLALGLGFLANQTVNWFVLVAASFTPRLNLYAFTFYLLTVLHALHVLGGVIPLTVITVRALRGNYSAAAHTGVIYTATYWHYLDIVWLLLFVLLMTLG